MAHVYAKVPRGDGTADPDVVVRDDGIELRRSASPEWAEYEAHLAAGGRAADSLPMAAWAGLNAEARARLRHARPVGPEPPLPVPPPDPAPPPQPPLRQRPPI